VRCWGYNLFGGLGDGTTTDRSTPPTSDVLTNVKAIALATAHTCALMETGGVRCWGANYHGQLGDGTTTDRWIPPTSDVLTGVKAIAAGTLHTCALMETGAVRCWGPGDLGYGTITDSLTPAQADVIAGGVQAIAAGGNRTCALMETGGVRCWGGEASSSSEPTPVQVVGTCE
jgi:alpha-tubulin suppressor-like RCC1 family protein